MEIIKYVISILIMFSGILFPAFALIAIKISNGDRGSIDGEIKKDDMLGNMNDDVDLSEEVQSLRDEINRMTLMEFAAFMRDYRESLSDHCPGLNDFLLARAYEFDDIASYAIKRKSV
ncbi:hypothetical protein ORI89_18730 [Sphingobacterium sp. UT-1RO-CII-1]|uniref:hypothetical protein n=1 Tax=Sphingobacterium sp. UT-1RO-CII-1 TaxID=2995225 RepID=UPI00227AD722|nr:hypothetical protein [Sphingobacterium sp. UT-1RO-CII-1]MCY4781693.1 hypothetical protein [Sphingobacterium sp. UT-1RO-CII-1]